MILILPPYADYALSMPFLFWWAVAFYFSSSYYCFAGHYAFLFLHFIADMRENILIICWCYMLKIGGPSLLCFAVDLIILLPRFLSISLADAFMHAGSCWYLFLLRCKAFLSFRYAIINDISSSSHFSIFLLLLSRYFSLAPPGAKDMSFCWCLFIMICHACRLPFIFILLQARLPAAVRCMLWSRAITLLRRRLFHFTFRLRWWYWCRCWCFFVFQEDDARMRLLYFFFLMLTAWFSRCCRLSRVDAHIFISSFSFIFAFFIDARYICFFWWAMPFFMLLMLLCHDMI